MKKFLIMLIAIGGVIGTLIGVLDAVGCMEEPDQCIPWAEIVPCTFKVEGADIELEVFVVAGKLAELGYFTGKLKAVKLEDVEEALKAFQRDIREPATGQMLPATWEKLEKIKMSSPIQKELEEVLGSCEEPTFFELLFPWGSKY